MHIILRSLVRLLFLGIGVGEIEKNFVRLRKARILIDNLFVAGLRAFQTAMATSVVTSIEVAYRHVMHPETLLDLPQTILHRWPQTGLRILLQQRLQTLFGLARMRDVAI